jgi:hypothetical protein
MLDRTSKMDSATVDLALTNEEIEIFSRARAASDGLRRTFDTWLDLGKAIQIAQRRADAGGGGIKTRGIRRMAIAQMHGQSRYGPCMAIVTVARNGARRRRAIDPM